VSETISSSEDEDGMTMSMTQAGPFDAGDFDMARGNASAASGEVYTRHLLVEWMLDRAGLMHGVDWPRERILDPGCGDGAFVCAVVERMLRSRPANPEALARSVGIVGVELDPGATAAARRNVARVLRNGGVWIGVSV
jgi:hypothetical protein